MVHTEGLKSGTSDGEDGRGTKGPFSTDAVPCLVTEGGSGDPVGIDPEFSDTPKDRLRWNKLKRLVGFETTRRRERKYPLNYVPRLHSRVPLSTGSPPQERPTKVLSKPEREAWYKVHRNFWSPIKPPTPLSFSLLVDHKRRNSEQRGNCQIYLSLLLVAILSVGLTPDFGRHLQGQIKSVIGTPENSILTSD